MNNKKNKNKTHSTKNKNKKWPLELSFVALKKTCLAMYSNITQYHLAITCFKTLSTLCFPSHTVSLQNRFVKSMKVQDATDLPVWPAHWQPNGYVSYSVTVMSAINFTSRHVVCLSLFQLLFSVISHLSPHKGIHVQQINNFLRTHRNMVSWSSDNLMNMSSVLLLIR